MCDLHLSHYTHYTLFYEGVTEKATVGKDHSNVKVSLHYSEMTSAQVAPRLMNIMNSAENCGCVVRADSRIRNQTLQVQFFFFSMQVFSEKPVKQHQNLE